MFRSSLFRSFRWIYRINTWVRRHFTPVGYGVLGLMIAAGVIGVDLSRNRAYQLFALSLALVFIALLGSLRFQPKIQVVRRLPRYGTLGEPLIYRLHLTNLDPQVQRDLAVQDALHQPWPSYREFQRWRRQNKTKQNPFDASVGYPAWLALLRYQRGANTQRTTLPPLPPNTQVSVSLQLNPQRRGLIYFSSVLLSRPDPLGIAQATARFPLSDRLLICPKRYPVPRFHLPGGRKYQRGGVQLASSVGDQGEFVGLRDYRPGDPLKRIHWRSLAKTGRPLVKELEEEYFTRHALILDTFIEDRASNQFEAAVSVAASLAIAERPLDSLLDLLFLGPTAYQVTIGRGLGQQEELLEALACVEPCRDQPFQRLSTLVWEQADALSGCLCVLLGWDAPRRRLVEGLRARGVPVSVLLVSAGEPVPGTYRIHPQRLGEDLAAWQP